MCGLRLLIEDPIGQSMLLTERIKLVTFAGFFFGTCPCSHKVVIGDGFLHVAYD